MTKFDGLLDVGVLPNQKRTIASVRRNVFLSNEDGGERATFRRDEWDSGFRGALGNIERK
jgi:hypothetical protein